MKIQLNTWQFITYIFSTFQKNRKFIHFLVLRIFHIAAKTLPKLFSSFSVLPLKQHNVAPWAKCEVWEKHTNNHQIEAMRWAEKSFSERIFFSFLFQSSAQISFVRVRSEIEKWFIKQHFNIAVMVLFLFSSIDRTQSRESSLIIDRKAFYFVLTSAYSSSSTWSLYLSLLPLFHSCFTISRLILLPPENLSIPLAY